MNIDLSYAELVTRTTPRHDLTAKQWEGEQIQILAALGRVLDIEKLHASGVGAVPCECGEDYCEGYEWGSILP